MTVRDIWSKLKHVAEMQCVSCHYLCASTKVFPDPECLPQAGRNELKRKCNFLQDEFELSCSKNVEVFGRLPINEIFDKVLRKRECDAYQPHNPCLTREQMIRVEVQMPSLYKMAIVLALIFALIADIGIGIAIWQALR